MRLPLEMERSVQKYDIYELRNPNCEDLRAVFAGKGRYLYSGYSSFG